MSTKEEMEMLILGEYMAEEKLRFLSQNRELNVAQMISRVEQKLSYISLHREMLQEMIDRDLGL